MSRELRAYNDIGIYHIMFRGVNKQNIFEEDFDYKVMCKYILELKKKFSFEIYAYCFMTNHVHLVLKESNMGDISVIMKNLLQKYAIYYNSKYERRGHLFEDRYKSKPVTNNEYLLASIRYVHRNPIKAFVVEKADDYVWSSYNEYTNNMGGLSDKEFLLSIIDLEQFKNMHCDESDDYDPFDKQQLILMELREHIVEKYNMEPEAIAELAYYQKREIINELSQYYTATVISRITKINRRTVSSYI